jgi:uroporphyrinogen decarboxylase
MNSRERILAAISHRQPDRVPVDLGGSTVTGIAAMAYSNLKKRLGIEKPTRVFDVVQQLANVDMVVINHFGVDALDINRISVESGDWYEVELADGNMVEFPSWYRPERLPDGSWQSTDAHGRILSRMPVGATCFDQTYFPYQNGYPDNFDGLKEALKTISWVVHSHAANLDPEE